MNDKDVVDQIRHASPPDSPCSGELQKWIDGGQDVQVTMNVDDPGRLQNIGPWTAIQRWRPFTEDRAMLEGILRENNVAFFGYDVVADSQADQSGFLRANSAPQCR